MSEGDSEIPKEVIGNEATKDEVIEVNGDVEVVEIDDVAEDNIDDKTTAREDGSKDEVVASTDDNGDLIEDNKEESKEEVSQEDNKEDPVKSTKESQEDTGKSDCTNKDESVNDTKKDDPEDTKKDDPEDTKKDEPENSTKKDDITEKEVSGSTDDSVSKETEKESFKAKSTEESNDSSTKKKRTLTSIEQEEIEIEKKKIRKLPPLNVIPRSETQRPIDTLFCKLMGCMLKTLDIPFTEQAIEQLGDLAMDYMHSLVDELHKLTEIQRRRKPARRDLMLLLRNENISTGKLEDEMERQKRSKGLVELMAARDKLEKDALQVFLQLSQPIEELDITDVSAPFFYNQVYEISSLVPLREKKRGYVPSWLPTFPPDHTHRTTPQYTDRITDPRKLREKLVEEGKLSEKALLKLMDNEEDEKLIDLSESEEDDDDNSVLSNAHHEIDSATDSETHNQAEPNILAGDKKDLDEEAKDIVEEKLNAVPVVPTTASTSFDIVAYAKKRLESIKRRDEKLEEVRRKKENNYFLKAESYLSPYAKNTVTETVSSEFQTLLDDEFKTVVRSVRLQEKSRLKRIRKLLEEKKLKEEQKERENVGEFEFNLNNFENGFEDGKREEEEEEEEEEEFHFADGFGDYSNENDDKRDEEELKYAISPVMPIESESVDTVDNNENDIQVPSIVDTKEESSEDEDIDMEAELNSALDELVEEKPETPAIGEISDEDDDDVALFEDVGSNDKDNNIEVPNGMSSNEQHKNEDEESEEDEFEDV